MDIRPARVTDAPAVAAIANGLDRPSHQQRSLQISPLAGGTEPSTLVMEGAGRVTGWVTVAPGDDPGVGYITELVVDSGERGRGYGRRLLVAATRLLSRAGFGAAELWVPASADGRPPAMPLELGWAHDGEAPGASVDQRAGMLRLVVALTPDREDHVRANRALWDDSADWWVAPGRRSWEPEQRQSPCWGTFAVPESQVGLLADVAGRDVVELGCGTGYVSAWCLEAGARSVVGIDNSPAQLASAAMFQAAHDLPFPLIWADAEAVPLAAGSFDLAISEYGAAIWCDPYRWLPEAARLLRPGGSLAFLCSSVLAVLCVNDYDADGPASASLQRPQRGLHRVTYADTTGVEFHLPHGDMLRLLHETGFDQVELTELYAPDGASDSRFGISADWARQWPVEEVWTARLAPGASVPEGMGTLAPPGRSS